MAFLALLGVVFAAILPSFEPVPLGARSYEGEGRNLVTDFIDYPPNGD
jgi:hypothetical protein